MDETEQELLDMLSEPTVERVRRDQINGDILMQRLGQALAPDINAMLDRLADRMIDNVKVSMEEWCPGCGEKALLMPELCEECLSVGK